MDRIRVEGVEFYGFHGVSAEEQRVGHRFRADLTLELPLVPAAENDDVALTVDYAAAAGVALEVGEGPSVCLVETLAERIATALLNRFPSTLAVEVRVAKLSPPTAIRFAAAAVEIRRVRVG